MSRRTSPRAEGALAASTSSSALVSSPSLSSNSSHAATPKGGHTVLLNVYDLESDQIDITKWNSITLPFGFGAFHTGIQIFGWEICYGEGRGITFLAPRTIGGATFRKSIRLGTTGVDVAAFSAMLDELREQFRGDDYSLLYHNCNHFTNEICKRLFGTPIPSYINKLAKFGQFCALFLPLSKLRFLAVDEGDLVPRIGGRTHKRAGSAPGVSASPVRSAASRIAYESILSQSPRSLRRQHEQRREHRALVHALAQRARADSDDASDTEPFSFADMLRLDPHEELQKRQRPATHSSTSQTSTGTAGGASASSSAPASQPALPPPLAQLPPTLSSGGGRLVTPLEEPSMTLSEYLRRGPPRDRERITLEEFIATEEPPASARSLSPRLGPPTPEESPREGGDGKRKKKRHRSDRTSSERSKASGKARLKERKSSADELPPLPTSASLPAAPPLPGHGPDRAQFSTSAPMPLSPPRALTVEAQRRARLMELVDSLDDNNDDGGDGLITLFEFLRDTEPPAQRSPSRPNFERLPALQRRIARFDESASSAAPRAPKKRGWRKSLKRPSSAAALPDAAAPPRPTLTRRPSAGSSSISYSSDGGDLSESPSSTPRVLPKSGVLRGSHGRRAAHSDSESDKVTLLDFLRDTSPAISAPPRAKPPATPTADDRVMSFIEFIRSTAAPPYEHTPSPNQEAVSFLEFVQKHGECAADDDAEVTTDLAQELSYEFPPPRLPAKAVARNVEDSDAASETSESLPRAVGAKDKVTLPPFVRREPLRVPEELSDSQGAYNAAEEHSAEERSLSQSREERVSLLDFLLETKAGLVAPSAALSTRDPVNESESESLRHSLLQLVETSHSLSLSEEGSLSETAVGAQPRHAQLLRILHAERTPPRENDVAAALEFLLTPSRRPRPLQQATPPPSPTRCRTPAPPSSAPLNKRSKSGDDIPSSAHHPPAHDRSCSRKLSSSQPVSKTAALQSTPTPRAGQHGAPSPHARTPPSSAASPKPSPSAPSHSESNGRSRSRSHGNSDSSKLSHSSHSHRSDKKRKHRNKKEKEGKGSKRDDGKGKKNR